MTKVASTGGTRPPADTSDRAGNDSEPRAGEFDELLSKKSSSSPSPPQKTTRRSITRRGAQRGKTSQEESQKETPDQPEPKKAALSPRTGKAVQQSIPAQPRALTPESTPKKAKKQGKAKASAEGDGKAQPAEDKARVQPEKQDKLSPPAGREWPLAGVHKRTGKKRDDDADPALAGPLAARGEQPALTTPVESPKPVEAPRLDAGEIRQIAQKILSSIQVHRAGDRTDVQMRVELGRLGGADVRLTKGDEGQVSISFQLESLEGQQAVTGSLQDLKDGLHMRGLKVGEIQVRTGEGPQLREAPQDQPGQQDRSQDDERQRRRQQEQAPEEIEES